MVNVANIDLTYELLGGFPEFKACPGSLHIVVGYQQHDIETYVS